MLTSTLVLGTSLVCSAIHFMTLKSVLIESDMPVMKQSSGIKMILMGSASSVRLI